jgi:two-component system, NarL family, invasion response regulator UvrY
MIRILIADDHPVVREGLRRMFDKTPDIRVADEAGNGQEVLDKVAQNDYDLILLDISMPGKDGLDILRELRRKSPRPPILILSIHSEEQYAIRALKAGATGYLSKKSISEELIKAVQEITSGRRYITSSLADKLASYIAYDKEIPIHKILSDREYKVMRMIIEGKTRKAIAEELSLSVNTISTYRARILDKLKMKTTAELTQYAMNNHLID